MYAPKEAEAVVVLAGLMTENIPEREEASASRNKGEKRKNTPLMQCVATPQKTQVGLEVSLTSTLNLVGSRSAASCEKY